MHRRGTFHIFDLFGKKVEISQSIALETLSEKHQLILAAARRRFAHYGFSKSTMDEIAADVGMAKPSLYYYYSTKEHLFTAVVSREQEQFVHDVDAALRKETSWSHKLKDYIALRVKLFRELVNLSQLGLNSWFEMKRVTGDLSKTFEQRELKFIQTILAGGNSAGEFAIPDVHKTAKLTLHTLQGLLLRTLRGERALDDSSYSELSREMECLIDHLITGIQKHS